VQVTPRADYPVGVRPRSWDEEGDLAALYAGVYDVALNQMVKITFVPDLGIAAPPFERERLPEDLDALTTPEQARLEAALFARYAVTPNAARAGTTERLPKPPWRSRDGGIVLYVTPDEFARFAADLEALAPDLGGSYSEVPISQLRGHPALDFVAELVSSPRFEDEDAFWLRDEG
jgi:hypothetical protein